MRLEENSVCEQKQKTTLNNLEIESETMWQTLENTHESELRQRRKNGGNKKNEGIAEGNKWEIGD